MNQNEQVIFNFYTAFQNLDAETMVSHYTDSIIFEDPGFGEIRGEDAKNMWRMLCKNAQDLNITFSITGSKGDKVTAHWDAEYTFSRTGRFVKNSIDATFTLENGKITDHRDHFNLWKWSQQALGTSGLLLGWSPFFRKKLHESTGLMLQKFGSKG